MATKRKRNEEDLEALFEQVAAERSASLVAAAATAPANEALAAEPCRLPASEPGVQVDPAAVYHRLGQLTRTLHDALRELGYDRKLAAAVESLPDARDRLGYIAKLSGNAAEKVLSAVERGQSIQQAVAADAAQLSGRWDRLYSGALSVDEFKTLAGDTRAMLSALSQRANDLSGELHAIMMAQDFHDLTGQVIKRVAEVAHTLEANLLQLLVEASPTAQKPPEHFLTGPAVREGEDVVADQAQVDELLESLGF